MKKVKVRDLPPVGSKNSGYSIEQIKLSKIGFGTPERGRATTRFSADLLYFRVDYLVVGPEFKQPKYTLTLTGGEVQYVLKAISNLVEILKKFTPTKDLVSP